MQVRFAPTARDQFLLGLVYVRRERPAAARRLRRRAEEVLRRLEQHSDSGRRIPEFPGLPYREVIVAPFRFFYRIDRSEAVVWVVAVWHGKQLPDEPE